MDNDLRLPGSFGGVKNLRRYTGGSYRETKKFLAKRIGTRYTEAEEFVFLVAKPIPKASPICFRSI